MKEQVRALAEVAAKWQCEMCGIWFKSLLPSQRCRSCR